MASFTAALPAVLMGAHELVSMQQKDKQRKLRDSQAQARADLQAQQQKAARARFDAQNKEDLNRAIAARRAVAAAHGMTSGGSAQAIIDGLIKQSEKKRRNFLTDQGIARSSVLGQSALQKKKNLLDQRSAYLNAGLDYAGRL